MISSVNSYNRYQYNSESVTQEEMKTYPNNCWILLKNKNQEK